MRISRISQNCPKQQIDEMSTRGLTVLKVVREKSADKKSATQPIFCRRTSAVLSADNIDNVVCQYTVFQKKAATIFMAVTSSNLNQFSKFFRHWKEKEISNKTRILFPTTP